MLNNEINEIIAKNLPQQVGEVLRKELADGVDAKILSNELEKKVKKLSVVLEEANSRLDKYQKQEKHYEDLEAREQALKENVLNLTSEILKIQLAEADKRINEIAGFVQMVFKSPVFRKSYMNDMTYDNGMPNGGLVHEEVATEE